MASSPLPSPLSSAAVGFSSTPCTPSHSSSPSSLRCLSVNLCILPPGVRYVQQLAASYLPSSSSSSLSSSTSSSSPSQSSDSSSSSSQSSSTWDEKKEARLRVLFEVISRWYDVLLLQEVWDCLWDLPRSSSTLTMVRTLADKAGFPYHAYASRRWFEMVNSGLLIVSRFPIVSHSQHTFQASAGLQWFTPNAVLHARISLPDSLSSSGSCSSLIDFFVTHLHAGPLDSSWRNDAATSIAVQTKQLQELLLFVKRVQQQAIDRGKDSAATTAWLVAGDFNSDALGTSSTSRDLLPFHHLREQMGVDSLLRATRYSNTYPVPITGSPFVNPAFVGHQTCVDHVFTNLRASERQEDMKEKQEKEVVRAKVLVLRQCTSFHPDADEAVKEEDSSNEDSSMYLSDHAAVDVCIPLPLPPLATASLSLRPL